MVPEMNGLRPDKMKTESAIILRDSTLREGMDVPGVDFNLTQRLSLAEQLADSGIPELEIIAPGRIEADLVFAGALKNQAIAVRTTGLIYAASQEREAQLAAVSGWLDHVDLLMSASIQRKPYTLEEKWRLLASAIDAASDRFQSLGVGFPNATQSDTALLMDLIQRSAERRISRITLYDTNGGSDPASVFELISRAKSLTQIPIFFHGHNDLDMATANSLAAVMAGADGIDVTVNGLGDRAGNCPLEPLAVALTLRGIHTGIDLLKLPPLARAVAEASGIPIAQLAPVVGAFVYCHKSCGHFEIPELFEAFSPDLVGSRRQLIQ